MIRDQDLRLPIELPDAERLGLGDLVPAPEPVLLPPPSAPDGTPRRILPVSETRLDGNEEKYLRECVTTNWISSQGPFVRRFEEAFAEVTDCRHAVSCSNGTTALHLALSTLDLGPGDEIIVPAFTMIAVANAVTYLGARPVFADVEADTLNLDPRDVERRLTERTRGIIAVHTYGHPAPMDELRAIADRQQLFLFEDAAEAHGARLNGRPVGSLGDAATFSFYGNKILSTGEGGMVTTNDERVATLARRLRDHAFSEDRHFWHRYVGFNYRMTNLQAAVGLAQTERLEALVTARRRNRSLYDAGLARVPGVRLPVERPGARNVFWMYGIRVSDGFGMTRDELRRYLAARGIETRTFFVPLHLQPVYYQAGARGRFPASEEAGRTGLYLPSSATLTEDEIGYVTATIAAAHGATA